MKNDDPRSVLRRGGPKSFLFALACTVPTLREALGRRVPAVCDAFDLRTLALGASHGKRCALQFVLGVWDPTADWDSRDFVEAWIRVARLTAEDLGFDPRESRLGKFDVFEALRIWDDDHRTAFLAWAKNPVWP